MSDEFGNDEPFELTPEDCAKHLEQYRCPIMEPTEEYPWVSPDPRDGHGHTGCLYVGWAIHHLRRIPDGSLGVRANRWREAKGLSLDPAWIATKLGEEVGEVDRALVGWYEQRDGRGDLVQEAAQSVIVLASLVEAVRPGADLFAAVEAEMERLGANSTNPFFPDAQGHHFVAPPGADGDYAHCRDCGIELTDPARRDRRCPGGAR